jgi:hypothetical protein
MSERKSNAPRTGSSELTSAGVPWSEVPDSPCPYTEWLDGRHGSAEDALPSVDQIPIPEVLLALPVLHPDRPTGSKPMADVSGARQRLANCRPGAWLISPFHWLAVGEMAQWRSRLAFTRYCPARRPSCAIAQRYSVVPYRNGRKMTPADPDQNRDAQMTRRRIFVGAASMMIAAPSIVRSMSLMKVRGLIFPIDRPSAGFIERLRFQYLEGALMRGWDVELDGKVVGGISEIQARKSVAYARMNRWLSDSVPSTSLPEREMESAE